jgi:tyrosyl-tRNA synthetase
MKPVNEQLAIIRQGTVQILPEDQLVKLLEEGRPLTVKLGCDPSRPDLHLGHGVVLKKLRDFQDLGHKVILIIGDFTGMIGDPTGKSKTRPALTLEETRENGKSYLVQATLILDPDPEKLQIVYNSDWLAKLCFEDLIKLSAKYTVARMLEREDFNERYKNEVPISVHEFLYPLAQAYDSVAIKSDIEIGGTDQTFNLLVGRDIQTAYGLKPQIVLTMPLLVGLDGSEKMSKSLDNYIGLTDAPEVIYPKLMKVPDSALPEYIKLLTKLNLEETMSLGPIEAHHLVAKTIISDLHGADAAIAGRLRYEQVAAGAAPDVMPEFVVPKAEIDPNAMIKIAKLLVLTNITPSTSEARRLIQGKGIKIDGEVVLDPNGSVELKSQQVLQKGKNVFVRVVVA